MKSRFFHPQFWKAANELNIPIRDLSNDEIVDAVFNLRFEASSLIFKEPPPSAKTLNAKISMVNMYLETFECELEKRGKDGKKIAKIYECWFKPVNKDINNYFLKIKNEIRNQRRINK